MPNLFDAPPNKIALVLWGTPGSGKTTISTRFPRPYIIDVDKNLAGPAKILREEKQTNKVIHYDHIDVDKNGKATEMPFRYDRMIELLKVACLSPEYDTIILDSTTTLNLVFQAYILRMSPTKTGNMEIPSWGQYLKLWHHILSTLRSSNKHIIVIGHETTELSEAGAVLRYVLALPGQIAHQLPALVTDCWRTEIEQVMVKDASGKFQPVNKYMIRTIQNGLLPGLKTALTVPSPIFEATQTNIDNILK